MARLQRGENEKIDIINDLVATVKSEKVDKKVYEESFNTLLKLFKPLILKICKKWSDYFNDSSHNIIPFAQLVADAEYWFIQYTLFKYTIDGSATYNKFIKDHIDSRIRYIYECELKYRKRNIFPDPDKNDDNNDGDMFDSVVYNYASNSRIPSIEDDIVDRMDTDERYKLAHAILDIIDNSADFTPREQEIFKDIMLNGKTHSEVGVKLNISRTRVTQILKKIKAKLYRHMNNSQDIWDLVGSTNITFDEQ